MLSKIHKISIEQVVTFLCCAFFTTLTISPDSYRVTALALSLIAIGTLGKTWRSYQNSDVKLISTALLIYFALYLLEMLIYSAPLRTIDLPSRAVLATLSLALLYKYPPKLSWIMISIILGSLLSGLAALYFSLELNRRAFTGNGYMVIQIGGICAWLGSLSLICFFYYIQQKYKYLALFAAAGASFALLATLLSGVRSAWTLTPFIILLIVWLYRHCLTLKRVSIAVLCIIAISIVAAPQIKTRINAALNDLVQYSQNNVKSSSGHRLEMWKSAIDIGLRHPVFGVGHYNLIAEKKRLIKIGEAHPDILEFKRAHNQYLEEFQTKGVPGFVGLLLMFFIPFLFFKRKWKIAQHYDHPELIALSLMGCVHILMIMGFCFTQHYLNHHSGILVFSFGLVIIAALTIDSERSIKQSTSNLNCHT